jgi:hypothetical protein
MRNQTIKAMVACLEWLTYCLKIGWSISEYRRLEALWWEFHDDDGNLCPSRHTEEEE